MQAGTKSEIYKNWQGLAIKGFDRVAFHKDGKPVKSSSKYELKWKDAKWRFASAEHRDLFKAAPEKYAPQYGGYCAWAVSQGTTAGVNPKNANPDVGVHHITCKHLFHILEDTLFDCKSQFQMPLKKLRLRQRVQQHFQV